MLRNILFIFITSLVINVPTIQAKSLEQQAQPNWTIHSQDFCIVDEGEWIPVAVLELETNSNESVVCSFPKDNVRRGRFHLIGDSPSDDFSFELEDAQPVSPSRCSGYPTYHVQADDVPDGGVDLCYYPADVNSSQFFGPMPNTIYLRDVIFEQRVFYNCCGRYDGSCQVPNTPNYEQCS